MLNFVNKEGKKVMELHDNGELSILNEKLKASFTAAPVKKEDKEEDGDE